MAPFPTSPIPDVAAEVAAVYRRVPEVVAVAMAGSVTTQMTDDHADIDLYVYAAEPIAITPRAAIAARFATRREVGNDVWEPGDEWLDARTGRHLDIMYRHPRWIEDQLDRVLVRHEASVGYSTCFWHNVLHSVPLYDRDGWYHELQAAARRPYPEPLKHAILAKNHPILRQSLSSYLSQIERAVDRGDGVSVQHRVTAVLASYFDILFAVNELPHPGEKRLLPFALTRCAKRPRCMEDRVRSLLGVPAMPTTPAVISAVSGLLDDLDALLEAEQMLAPAVSDVRDTGAPNPDEEAATSRPSSTRRGETLLAAGWVPSPHRPHQAGPRNRRQIRAQARWSSPWSRSALRS
jgi:hypothetical protein